MDSLRFPSKCGITTALIREETTTQFYKQKHGYVTTNLNREGLKNTNRN